MTVTVVVIVSAGFLLASFLRPFAPAPPPNTEALLHGDYLSKSAQAPVRWRSWSRESLAEAAASSKPILLTLGRWGIPSALHLDRQVLTDPEVAEQINRSFVPIRVDLEESPEWQSAFLPLRKMSLLPEPLFELAVLTPDLKLAYWTSKDSAGELIDFSGMVDLLTRARRAALERSPQEEEMQESELSRIEALRTVQPDGSHFEELLHLIQAQGGLLEESGRRTLRPYLWRGMASNGRLSEAVQSFLEWAESPMMDGVGQTFFFTGEGKGDIIVEPFKLLEPNLDAMAFLAQASQVMGRSDLAVLAQGMAEGISKEFLQGKWPASALAGEAEAAPQVNRFAVKPSDIWRTFSPEDQAVLHRNFQFDQLAAGSYLPRTRTLQALTTPSDEFQSVRDRLLDLRQRTPPERSAAASTSSVALAASRFLAAGAMLDRPDFEDQGSYLLAMAESAWKGQDVRPLLNRPGGSHSLGAALTLCEAYLTKWNLAGDLTAKEKGEKLMRLIVKRHLRPDGRMIEEGAPDAQKLIKPPLNFLDGAARSDASLLIELLSSWAAITGDEEMAGLSDMVADRWRGQALLASPLWMSLFEAVKRAEAKPVSASSREEWLKAATRSFGQTAVRTPSTQAGTQEVKSPSLPD